MYVIQGQRIDAADNTWRAILGWVLLAWSSAAVPAQPQQMEISLPANSQLFPAQLDEASSQTHAQLERFSALLANRQWDEAVSTLTQLMELAGQQMIAVDAPAEQVFGRYVSVRQFCQRQLTWPAPPERQALQLYRRRVDPLVQRWYEDALRNRDKGLLRRIADDYFASTYGDDALFVLGEMALEQADHAGARWHWERIDPALRCPESLPVPSAQGGLPLWLALRHADWERHGADLLAALEAPPASPHWLAYPDSDIPQADLRARLTLVSILEGSPATGPG